jgi:flagellar motor switch protein FliM
MAAGERDNAGSAPWLQSSQPDQPGLAIERLPGLAFALEQFALNIPEALAPLCKAQSPGTIDETKSAGVFEVVRGCEGLTAAVVNCPQFDQRLLMIFDRRIADALVAAVLGGDGETATSARPSRDPTGIEMSLIGEFARLLAKALDKGFAPTVDLALTAERLETLADIHILGRRDMPAVTAALTIDMPGGPLALTLLLPQAFLLPVRKNLALDPGGDGPPADPRWTRQMEDGVTKTRIAVTAVLDEFDMTLGEVADLAVGQVLNLHGAGMGRVRLECGGREMFWCKLDNGEGHYALEVEEPVEQESDPVTAAPAI